MHVKILRAATVALLCTGWAAAAWAQSDAPLTNETPAGTEDSNANQTDDAPLEAPAPPDVNINAQALSVSPLVVGFGRGEPLGSYQGGIFCWGGGDYVWDSTENKGRITKVMDARLRQRLKDRGFTIPEDPTDIFGELKDESKFIVGGIITKIHMKVCYPKIGYGDVTRSAGTASMSITWKIFSKDEKKVVATIDATAENAVPKGITGEEYSILLGAFDMVLDQLMATPEFAGATTR